jgi:hypothetical protein
MSNPAIPREDVHSYSEACSDLGMAFQSVAARLVREQSRLKSFIESNFSEVDPMAGQVALYMFAVSLRVYEQAGGRLKKVNGMDLSAAQKRVQESLEGLLPLDDGFPGRAKGLEWRAQPHLLDEILWALYERDDVDRKDEEAVLDDNQSAMIYLMLWTAIEALDSKWRP